MGISTTAVCLFFNIAKYIEWTTLKNRGSLNFRKSNENLDSYIEILRDCYKNSKYVKLTKINSVKNNDKNLRMSIWEI
jgi:hypothetical protein